MGTRDSIICKKYDHDMYLDGKLTVFQPYLAEVAPQFYERVLKNTNLLSIMTDRELETTQQIIDFLIYGYEDFENTLNKCYLTVLSVLVTVSDSALEKIIITCCNLCLKNVNETNVISTLDLIRKNLCDDSPQWCKKLRIGLLDFIKESPMITQILKDPEVFQNYSGDVLKRTNTLPLRRIELPTKTKAQNSLTLKCRSMEKKDVQIRTTTKSYSVHKTVLMSQSTFFEALFSSDNWKNQQKNELFNRMIDFVIEYCYGHLLMPNELEIVDVILTAHEHGMNDMIVDYSKYAEITSENFDTYCKVMGDIDESQYKSLETFIGKLVEYATDNYKTFKEQNVLQLPPCVCYPLLDHIINQQKENNQ